MMCDVGTLNAACTYCECSEQVFIQIFSSQGHSLGDVTVAHTSAPLTVLNTSTASGDVTLDNTCQGHTYVLQREGYLDLELTLTGMETNFTQQMQALGSFPLD